MWYHRNNHYFFYTKGLLVLFYTNMWPFFINVLLVSYMYPVISHVHNLLHSWCKHFLTYFQSIKCWPLRLIHKWPSFRNRFQQSIVLTYRICRMHHRLLNKHTNVGTSQRNGIGIELRKTISFDLKSLPISISVTKNKIIALQAWN